MLPRVKERSNGAIGRILSIDKIRPLARGCLLRPAFEFGFQLDAKHLCVVQRPVIYLLFAA